MHEYCLSMIKEAFALMEPMNLGSNGLARVRQLREEREKRRRERALARQGACGTGVSAPSDQTCRTTARGSPRQRRRVEEIHTYLCSKVDPVMASLILTLITDRPDDVRDAALNFLLKREEERTASSDASIRTNSAASGSSRCKDGATDAHQPRRSKNAVERLAQRRDRLFMVQEIGPLISELINRTLRCMPDDVEVFLIEQLQHVHRDNKGARTSSCHIRMSDSQKSLGMNSGSNSISRQRRSSTARSRLEEAQSLDLAVQRSTPPGAEATAIEQRSSRMDHEPDPSDSDIKAPVGERVVADGVKESSNKPRDVQDTKVASKKISCSSAVAPAGPATASSAAPASQPEDSAAFTGSSPQTAVVLLLGIDGAGKTTLLAALQGEHDPRVRPSVGFKPVTMALGEQLRVKMYDIGGGEKIRGIWSNYYHDAHALLYVIDGTDAERWKESRAEFLRAMAHKYLRGKPVVVILNKEDAGIKLDPDEVAEDLDLTKRPNARVWCCSVNPARATGGAPDVRMEQAVEWLLGEVQANFSAMDARVQRDLRDVERQFQREKETKQLGVLRGLLRKAFPDGKEEKREDCFDETEGLEFLTSEIGLAGGALPPEGVEIAALVGYQKLALQMVGNMKCPISRKNQARSWEEIRQLVVALRRQIGITEDGVD